MGNSKYLKNISYLWVLINLWLASIVKSTFQVFTFADSDAWAALEILEIVDVFTF